MKQMICALLMGIGLLVAFAPQAAAHGFSRTVIVHEGKVVRKFRPAYPHWLRAQRDFQRWYRGSRYRHERHADWRRLYELYRQDARYHRHLRNRLHHRNGRGCRHH